jgi:hypothetical protein
LAAPYQTSKGRTPVSIQICLFGLLVVVAFSAPFSILPMKDSIEVVRGKGKFSKSQNKILTAVLVGVCCLLSCAVLSVGQVITILGATTNSAIGFLLPILFYLKVESKSPKFTKTKIAAYFLFIFVCCSSIVTLTLFAINYF